MRFRATAAWCAALAVSALVVAPWLASRANAAGPVLATVFGPSQNGIAIGITSRSVSAGGGPHVLVEITTKNAGQVPLTLSPLTGVRLAVVDSAGKDVPKSGACSESEGTPPPLEFTFAPGEARIELGALDLTCYAVKPGHDFSVTAFARATFVTDGAGSAPQSVDVQSNTISVGLPDTLSITSCPVPSREVKVVKAVTPEYPLVARAEGLYGVAYVAVILDEQGSIQDAFIYRSSGARSLDDATLVAAKRSQYAPEIRNCVPVSGAYLFRAEFMFR